ncbi:MAG TPA: lysophospholipid acyltransferase family protein [Polyangiales bacterium]
MPTKLETARSSGRAVAMGALTVGMLAGVTLHQKLSPLPEEHALFQSWMKQWASGLLQVFGVEATLATAVPREARGARLIVANHRSPLDILLLLRLFGGVVLSRGDLANWPVLGLAARRAETIFVDRDDAMSGVMAVRQIRERLRQGRTVIVFPEGTTHRGDNVHPFQQGAFVAARGLPVEVLPVGIAYQPGAEFVDETFVQHMTRVAGRPATHLACAIGRPRILCGTRKQLASSLTTEVQALVHDARHVLRFRTMT